MQEAIADVPKHSDLDSVTDIDRRLHALLMGIADRTPDEAIRQRALRLTVTLPSFRDWSEDTVRAAHERLARYRPPDSGRA